jgi:large subunit ribosomal protein L18
MIIHHSKTRRQTRVRAKLNINQTLPRLSVFRSNRHIWAQIIDDQNNKTLLAISSKSLKLKSSEKTKQAALVGQALAENALKKNIKEIRFDRGPYQYHGRVKALAQAARLAGLKF